MIFNCISENGPPFPAKPIRVAGTWAQYSKKAMNQERVITPIRGQWLITLASCNFRCPYQAKVMKILEVISSPIVYNPFMSDIDMVIHDI